MSVPPKNLIVVGQGAAGLTAALAAAQDAQARAAGVRITLVDKASADEAGGNTRWSPSNMRRAAIDRVEPSFVHDMLAATQFQGDESYFARLAAEAPATVQWIAAQELRSVGLQLLVAQRGLERAFCDEIFHVSILLVQTVVVERAASSRSLIRVIAARARADRHRGMASASSTAAT